MYIILYNNIKFTSDHVPFFLGNKITSFIILYIFIVIIKTADSYIRFRVPSSIIQF